MTKLSSSFSRRRELIIVEAKIEGPRGSTISQLVFDTGAEATTLTSEVVEEIGYSPRDGHKPSKVHSARRSRWVKYAVEKATLRLTAIYTAIMKQKASGLNNLVVTTIRSSSSASAAAARLGMSLVSPSRWIDRRRQLARDGVARDIAGDRDAAPTPTAHR